MTFLGIAACGLFLIFLFGTKAGRQLLGVAMLMVGVFAVILFLSAQSARERNQQQAAQQQQVEQQELAAAEHTPCPQPGLPPNLAKYVVHCNPQLDH